MFENKTISTGEPSTLKTYRKIAVIMGGENTKATQFIDDKISESPKGENEVVIADESQMLFLLVQLLSQ